MSVIMDVDTRFPGTGNGHKCEICNLPAVSIVYDIKEVYAEIVRTYERIETPHFFCLKHNRNSKTYNLE